MKRASISLCLASVILAPGCASKSDDPPTDAPAASAGESNNASESEDGGAPATTPELAIDKIQIAVRTHNLNVIFDTIEEQTARWTGTSLRLIELLAAVTGKGAALELDLQRPMSFDAAYPQPGQPAGPGELEIRSYLPAAEPRAFVERDGTMQPLGEGLWRLQLSEALSMLVREESGGVTIANDIVGLDRARSEYNTAEALDPRFQLQVEIANFPRDSIDPTALLNMSELSNASTISKIIQELTGLRLQAGFEADSSLGVLGRASAPFESLGLSPLGPKHTTSSPLAATLPGGAMLGGVLSMSNSAPAIRELNALVQQMGEVPPPFDDAVEGITTALRGVLGSIQGEVAFAVYLTKKREIAVVAAAQTPKSDAARDAIRALSLELEAVLKSHIALVGEDPNERYTASFKPDGLGFAKARADILAIDLSKAMVADMPPSAAVLLGKKRNRIEILSFVEGDSSMVAFGAGARTVMSDYLRGLRVARTSSLESTGGLEDARALTGGCQLCVAFNPHELMRVVLTMDELEGDDRLQPFRRAVDTRALDVEFSVGAALDPQHATLGIAIPGELVAPSDDTLLLLRTLFRLSDDSASMSAPVTLAGEK